MTQVALVARFKAKDGRGEELIAALRPLLDRAAEEPGTLLYVLQRSKDDPDTFWTSEIYADDEAFAAHSGSDVMAAAAPVLGPLLAESEVLIGEPLSAKGVPG
jgi:autoinducer 2-degrading protein